jgi:hypothetical protein
MNCYWKNNDFDKSGALLISNVDFSYTVFLNNMFLRYMGVSRISGWSKKIIIIIGGLSEAKTGSKYPNRYMDY